MSTSWDSADIKCPFYKKHSGNSITCECMLVSEKGTVTHNFFVKHDMQRHIRRCCCADYRRCLYYRLLLQSKYG